MDALSAAAITTRRRASVTEANRQPGSRTLRNELGLVRNIQHRRPSNAIAGRRPQPEWSAMRAEHSLRVARLQPRARRARDTLRT